MSGSPSPTHSSNETQSQSQTQTQSQSSSPVCPLAPVKGHEHEQEEGRRLSDMADLFGHPIHALGRGEGEGDSCSTVTPCRPLAPESTCPPAPKKNHEAPHRGDSTPTSRGCFGRVQDPLMGSDVV